MLDLEFESLDFEILDIHLFLAINRLIFYRMASKMAAKYRKNIFFFMSLHLTSNANG